METSTFETISRRFGTGLTRRQGLRGLVAGVVALGAGGAVGSVQAASPQLRRRRKQRRQRRHTTSPTPQNSCGVQGDGCGALDADTGQYSAPYCCHGYECVYSSSNGSSSWTCQARP